MSLPPRKSCRSVECSSKRRRILGLGGLGLLVPSVFGGCGGGGSQHDVAADLRELLTQRWAARYGGINGGLTLVLLTPEGSHFASTLDGVGEDSCFRGASTTKTFTAAAIMLLDQRGALKVDDLVTASMPGRSAPYLPDTPTYDIPHKGEIRIRQLLQHRAGVFDLANDRVPKEVDALYAGEQYTEWQLANDKNHTFTKDELVGVVALHKLTRSPPGSGYRYSDTHYTLLGKIVEEVSGLPLDVFETRELLHPNGLYLTHFVIDGRETTLPSPSIHGYSLIDGQAILSDDYNYSYDPGSGNVFTTPAELARWIRRLIRGEAGVSPSQVARMCDVMPDSSYGLGIVHRAIDGCDLGYGHEGGTAGYMTSVQHDPISDVTYVLQCSLIDQAELAGEGAWLWSTAAAARRLVGY
jgi:D-alanyl-D-alanine carboxypeptidase